MSTTQITTNLKINGTVHTIQIEPRVSLLDAIRDHVGLKGTKKGCNQGACGACTLLVDGERINSCLTLACQYEEREIQTIEQFAEDALHPLQTNFIKCDGFQCGYCTPGQICSAIGMASEVKNGVPSYCGMATNGIESNLKTEIRERMSGNLCRCGAYNGIVEAIAKTFDLDELVSEAK